MDAIVWAGGSTVEVRQLPTPEPPPQWVLVEVAYAGLCGTDLHIASDEHPRARPGVVLGHEMVGRVAVAVDGLAAGSPVFVNPLLFCGNCATCTRGRTHICEHLGLLGIDVDGGAAEVVAVPKTSLVPLPANVDMRTAALIEPLSVAVRALRRARLHFGDHVHVLGAGPIGLLVASCSRWAGAAAVTVSEVAPARAEAAQALGFVVVDHDTPAPVADVVFDCTGHPAVSPTVTRWLVPGGLVTVVAAYPGVVSVDLQDVMMRELALVGVRVYTAEDILSAMTVVATDGSDLGRLVTAVLPLAEGPSAIAALRSGSELKVLLKGPAA